MKIKLEKLNKTYLSKDGSKIKAVSNVSLDIPENRIFGIIGKSGAGKSSLVRLISLLEAPDSGAVYYGEKRVDNLKKNQLIAQRRKIGMIFQNFNLFTSRTAGKNIAYPLEICGTPKNIISTRVKEMLSLVGLEEREDAPISTLSGGQKQRVAIARALATNPDILFCDEATSALDPQTTRSILALIRDIQKKMNLTVVMITHQMEVVRDACDQVAVIENGAVVEQGSVEELFSNPRTETTKDFLRNISHTSDEPFQNISSNLVKWSKKGGKYTLRFAGESSGEPILSKVAKNFDIDFNILAAGIEKLPDCQVGTMLVDIVGEKAEIERAVAFLNENNVSVQEETSGGENK